MSKWRFVPLCLGFTLGLILLACGCGDNTGDPTLVVKELFQAMEDKEFERIPAFACATQKDQVRQIFDFGAIMSEALGDADADPQAILDIMALRVSDLQVEERSKDGQRAVVRVKGRLELTVDPEKFRELVEHLLQERGVMDLSDDLINQYAEPVLQQFEEFRMDLDDDLRVVKEGGAWVICGE